MKNMYLIGSHCLVADLPADGTFNDARHQLGNVFVIFFLAWNLLHYKQKGFCIVVTTNMLYHRSDTYSTRN